MIDRILRVGAAILFAVCLSPCQQTPGQPAPGQPDSGQPDQEAGSKHVLWIIPNYRTSPTLANYEPISVREKFKLASEDSFDRGTIALGAVFAGEAQLTNSNKAFGQGAQGYGKYFGTSYGDFLIGNMMTEGVFPSILHQDPRYFRRGTGSGWSRLGYAVGQIFITHSDRGTTQFNYSEVVGNSVAVAISNAYYVDNRSARDGVSQLGLQLGVDMAANVLKEFWPDLDRGLKRKHQTNEATVR